MIAFFVKKTPLIFFTQSLWRDEAFSYLLAKKNIFEIVFLTARDFNPPLYYFLLHFWMKVFGTSEIALRLPSLIFFWATIYVSFLFLNEVFQFSTKKSFFYLVFFLLNPLLNYYAFEARMYTLFVFFSSLSFYAFITKKKTLYFYATFLGLLTHYFMIFTVLSQIAFYLFFLKKTKEKNHLNYFDLIKPLLFFLPWIIYVLIVNQSIKNNFWIFPLKTKDLFHFLSLIYFGYESSFNYFNFNFNPITFTFFFLLIFSFYYFLKNKKNKDRGLVIFFFFWSIVPSFFLAILSLKKPFFLPRYLIFANIGLVLFIIFLINKLPLVLKIITIFIIISQTISFNNLQIKYRNKTDIRKTIKKIKILANKDDYLYVINELNYFTAIYYFGDEKRVFIYQKTYDEIPNYVGKILIPKEKTIFHLPIYPKKVFILSSENNYEIQSSL